MEIYSELFDLIIFDFLLFILPSHVPDDSFRPYTYSTNRKYLACLINTSMSRISFQKTLFQSALMTNNKGILLVLVSHVADGSLLVPPFFTNRNAQIISTFNMSRISIQNALTSLILFNYGMTIEVLLMFCDF